MAIKPLVNESELLRNIAAGDQRAFTILFKHYQRYVFVTSKRITHSEELAAEIVQDIFLKIWAGREKIGIIETFGAYLNRLVRNHAFNILRQLAQDAKSNLKLSVHYREAEDTTNQQIDYNETSKILQEVINGLPEQQRLVYTLCHIQGMRYDDVAAQMNISPVTVHAHMKQALKKIRAHFKANAVVYTLLIIICLKNKH